MLGLAAAGERSERQLGASASLTQRDCTPRDHGPASLRLEGKVAW